MGKRVTVLLLSLIPSLITFAQSFESEGIIYEVTSVNDRSLTLVWGGKSQGDVVIPENVTYNGVTYKISNIEDRAFADCYDLTSIILPQGVIRVGEQSFNNCISLTSINIPLDVIHIDATAFDNCIRLTSKNYYSDSGMYEASWYEEQPEGLLCLGNVACGYKGEIPEGAEITIPDGITSIMRSAFSDRLDLTSIKIPESLTGIGEYAFSGCENLVSISIPEGVTTIGEYAFSGCTSLSSISFPESLGHIGSHALDDTQWFEEQEDGLVIVSNIVYGYKGSYPARIVIPEGVKSIGEDAFNSYSGINYVILPSTLKRIEEMAFLGCTGLTSISLPEGLESIGLCGFYGCSGLTEMVIPESVKNIGNGAFQTCRNLASINIPSGVSIIRDDVFSTCDSLSSIILPDNVVRIGEDAFERCISLTSIRIPDNVRRIGQRAFMDCALESSLVIPESVTEIGQSAFQDCAQLSSIHFPDGLEKIESYLLYGCVNLENVTIPESVSWIGYSAFSGCKNLASIKMPEDLNTIMDNAFYNCSGLTSINIPEGVTYIGENAFGCCKGLSSIIIPEYVSTIGNNAFYECLLDTVYWYSHLDASPVIGCFRTNIKHAVIGGKAERIASHTFMNCINLNSVVIQSGVADIEDGAFLKCFNLVSVVLPSGLKSIGEDAFSGCERLTSLTLPEGLTSISKNAFYGCTGLISITVPLSVDTIGDYAFRNCTSLKDVRFEGAPEIGYNAFWGCNSIKTVTSAAVAPKELSSYYPFAVGDYADIADNSANNGLSLSPSYNSELGRTVTSISRTGIASWDCYIDWFLPAGTYKVSVGMLPSPENKPNYFHPQIDGFLFSDSAVSTVTLLNEQVLSGRRLKPVYYSNDMTGYDSVMIADTLTIPSDLSSIKILLSVNISNSNAANYSSKMILDRIFFEPYEEMEEAAYVGPFTGNVFRNAILYVPEGSMGEYQSATGWRYFSNIAVETKVDQFIQDDRSDAAEPVVYDITGRRIRAGVGTLAPGLYIIDGTKRLIK